MSQRHIGPTARKKTYAVLGATGSTGSAITRHLLSRAADHTQSTALRINVYARSSKKLLSLLPALRSAPNTALFEGSLDDTTTLTTCLRRADYIFSCVAAPASEPGENIALETATAIISALRQLRAEAKEEGDYQPPTVVMLSSASLSPVFTAKEPYLVKLLLETALVYNYADPRRAEALYHSLRASDPDLLTVVFCQAPALVPGKVQTGHEISTERNSFMVSFADLGAGMVEMAERSGELGLGWRGVTVNGTGEVAFDYGTKVRVLMVGLVASLLPRVWRFGRNQGWW